MTYRHNHITVCICTYRRLGLLEKLLDMLSAQTTEGKFSFSCVVVDNDAEKSAQALIERLKVNFPVPLYYALELERNFARVRNAALGQVQSEFVAFIDDDEVPREDWLIRMWSTLKGYGADAVLAPVQPYFDKEPPRWITRSRICERPSYPTGTAIHWRRTRTGNVLLRTAIVTVDGIRFDPAYGSGGEDIDFFRRAAGKGRRFVWCDEAPAFELVPDARLTRMYHLRRALHQGQISWRYATNSPSVRASLMVASKAMIAVVSYSIALPLLFLCGDHLGMKYLIKDCHHIARLCAMCGIPLSRTRKY